MANTVGRHNPFPDEQVMNGVWYIDTDTGELFVPLADNYQGTNEDVKAVLCATRRTGEHTDPDQVIRKVQAETGARLVVVPDELKSFDLDAGYYHMV